MKGPSIHLLLTSLVVSYITKEKKKKNLQKRKGRGRALMQRTKLEKAVPIRLIRNQKKIENIVFFFYFSFASKRSDGHFRKQSLCRSRVLKKATFLFTHTDRRIGTRIYCLLNKQTLFFFFFFARTIQSLVGKMKTT